MLTNGILSVFHMKNFIIHVKEALNHAHPPKCPFWQHIKQETNIKKEKKSSCQVISEAVTSCIPFAICCQTDLSIYHGPGFFQLFCDLPPLLTAADFYWVTQACTCAEAQSPFSSYLVLHGSKQLIC